jgi:hypothetical protein
MKEYEQKIIASPGWPNLVAGDQPLSNESEQLLLATLQSELNTILVLLLNPEQKKDVLSGWVWVQ